MKGEGLLRIGRGHVGDVMNCSHPYLSASNAARCEPGKTDPDTTRLKSILFTGAVNCHWSRGFDVNVSW